MAFPLKGNTSTNWQSPSYNLPMWINGFSIVNKTVGVVGVDVYLIAADSSENWIAAYGMSICPGNMYYQNRSIPLLATETIKVVTNGSVDYNFTLDNMPIVSNEYNL